MELTTESPVNLKRKAYIKHGEFSANSQSMWIPRLIKNHCHGNLVLSGLQNGIEALIQYRPGPYGGIKIYWMIPDVKWSNENGSSRCWLVSSLFTSGYLDR